MSTATSSRRDLMIRNMDPEVLERFRRQAGARMMTHAQYLERLMALAEGYRDLVLANDLGPLQL